MGVGRRIRADQIPADIIDEKTFILTQNELPAEENNELFAKAKKKGATTIFNLSPNPEMHDINMDNIDYLICREDFVHLLRSAGIAEIISVPNLSQCPNPRAAEDAFCGTFVGSLEQGLEKEEALKRAEAAYDIASTRGGGLRALPYSDDIINYEKD